jgi:hypothetical protein
MEYYIGDVFSNKNWIIELPSISKRNTKKYYCPKGRIRHTKMYTDVGATLNDI